MKVVQASVVGSGGGVVELLRRGKLPADYWDWAQGAAFKWGMGEEDAEAMAQGTAQITAAIASTATTTPPPLPPAGPTDPAAAGHTGPDPAAAAAAVSSLFAPDGHAFESGAAAPAQPLQVTGIPLSLPFVLRPADDLATPYTNYTSGYKALLDYVWYEESALRVLRAVPMPSEAVLASFIPSRSFPSDHLAVVYDMEWRQPQADGEAP
ncbi:2',5'-phosphodiesterase 12 [Tetrabaena socialis]|uniref:2',5'-phosphodiesterase 12 n=1 Tax=Tetrabaena socialis TaxID=47790 RepID=A0A2J8A1W8_9CHLO|nr:2',5'-phosphodiesterase 12 [Tetrabaena socialis]|eukprot:PNH06495.1 2',5'-phosphodiesterase 12 [Tetrabaena socialis]